MVAGRALGPRASVDVGALVRARAEALAPWAALRAASRIAAAGDAAGRSSTPTRVARAVDNLLRNARRGLAAKGRRSSRRVEEPPAPCTSAIADRGPGVPDGRAGELFEPFFTTKPDGTGLGLAISRAIARAHGGDLTYARQGATHPARADAAGWTGAAPAAAEAAGHAAAGSA